MFAGLVLTHAKIYFRLSKDKVTKTFFADCFEFFNKKKQMYVVKRNMLNEKKKYFINVAE